MPFEFNPSFNNYVDKKGGGGVSKKSTLVHPGGEGVIRMSMWTKLCKKVKKNHGK